MKKLLVILFIFLSTSVNAINPLDKIAPNDKQLHFMANYIGSDFMQNQWKLDWWQSGLAVLGLGFVKEEIDKALGGKRDITDIQANMIGWVIYNIVHL